MSNARRSAEIRERISAIQREVDARLIELNALLAELGAPGPPPGCRLHAVTGASVVLRAA